MQQEKEALIKNIEDAEMVLIGLGAEFAPKKSDFEASDLYKKFYMYNKSYDISWIEPIVYKYWVMNHENLKIKNSYNFLYKFIKNKNYFVVTLCTDDLIYTADFDNDRVVSPCGRMNYIQCKSNCTDDLYLSDLEYELQIINALKEENIEVMKSLKKEVCPKCGADFVFNNIFAEKYNESGYLGNWEKYTNWLQQTLNKKICILEMGVNFDYPSVIRFPFEKIAFLNNKASFYRVNEKWYHLTDEIKGKGTSISCNSNEFLSNLFV